VVEAFQHGFPCGFVPVSRELAFVPKLLDEMKINMKKFKN
jgi:hypothetical protein